jgi:hypothetical protein
MRALLSEARAYQPVSTPARAAHRDWIAFTQAQADAFGLLATSLETGDEDAARAARAKEEDALGHLRSWGEKVTGDCPACLTTVAEGG